MHCLLKTKVYSELCEIINEENLPLYAPHERFTLGRLQAAYGRYQTWFQSMPDVLSLQNTGMPQVIAMYMLYHLAIMQ